MPDDDFVDDAWIDLRSIESGSDGDAPKLSWMYLAKRAAVPPNRRTRCACDHDVANHALIISSRLSRAIAPLARGTLDTP
jgi:hypothetical protein